MLCLQGGCRVGFQTKKKYTNLKKKNKIKWSNEIMILINKEIPWFQVVRLHSDILLLLLLLLPLPATLPSSSSSSSRINTSISLSCWHLHHVRSTYTHEPFFFPPPLFFFVLQKLIWWFYGRLFQHLPIFIADCFGKV